MRPVACSMVAPPVTHGHLPGLSPANKGRSACRHGLRGPGYRASAPPPEREATLLVEFVLGDLNERATVIRECVNEVVQAGTAHGLRLAAAKDPP
jgi:hypothetical protein